ncbi:MAG: phosphate acetyltransferase [Planctomycetes bacterium]|nr:phosphate acetyltransferase [Planctomycetota bacterium]MBL7039796.1 phosphate acetyltransferase [Pirellulaceae bacterium]
MANNLYIASTEPRSSKSLVALGVMELLSRRIQKLGFFRPVIRAGDEPDNDIELVRRRYGLPLPYESLYAATHEEARHLTASGRMDELLERILAKYKALERQCDFVVCEGTDFSGVAAAFEFDFNAQVANHLGCPVLIVASGRLKTAEEVFEFVHAAREAFVDEGCQLAGTVVNRVEPELVDQVRERFGAAWPHEDPIYVLPQVEILSKPTVGEIAEALGGRPLHRVEDQMKREVREYKVAAMFLPNFLDHVQEGTLVITPGDRADIVLGSLATVFSDNYPIIAGIVLTGGLELAPQLQRMIEGFGRSVVPVISVPSDTFETATRIDDVNALITPDNDRKTAAALGVFESNVDLSGLEQRIAASRSDRITPLMFEYELIQRAKASRQHIVLPEGTDDRILRASEILLRREVVDITLLGAEAEIHEKISSLGLDLDGATVVDPNDSPLHDDFAQTYFELRQHKGINEDVAHDVMRDVSYFGTMMVYKGLVDAMVSGAAHTTAHTIRPSFEFIKTRPECSIVSSVFFMCLEDRVLVYGDCAIIPNPTPSQLADIAISSAETAKMFGVDPLVAMLSYSSGQSGLGEDVDKVREATRLVREHRPDLKVDGPIQYDAAVDASVARKKMPDSEVAGRATVFIFPDLNTGNNTYKAVQRSSGAVAIGPVLQGLKKPVNDLSRGCTVPDIVNTVAITAIQAQSAKGSP